MNAKGKDICENVCGIYDLIYESGYACVRCTYKQQSNEANKFRFHATHIYTNTWSLHTQEHTVFFVFTRMFYFVVVASIELLVLKENYNK